MTWMNKPDASYNPKLNTQITRTEALGAQTNSTQNHNYVLSSIAWLTCYRLHKIQFSVTNNQAVGTK